MLIYLPNNCHRGLPLNTTSLTYMDMEPEGSAESWRPSGPPGYFKRVKGKCIDAVPARVSSGEGESAACNADRPGHIWLPPSVPVAKAIARSPLRTSSLMQWLKPENMLQPGSRLRGPPRAPGPQTAEFPIMMAELLISVTPKPPIKVVYVTHDNEGYIFNTSIP